MTNLLGKAPCDDYETLSNQCDQYHVTLDLAAINVGENDGIHQHIVACHELGHTVGLTHRTANCMTVGLGDDASTNIVYRRYNESHHIPDHINTWF